MAAPAAMHLVPVVAMLAISVGCGQGREAAGDSAVVRAALQDSAMHEAAAFAALPPSLRAELDLRPYLTPTTLRDTSVALCRELGAMRSELRRRLRLRLGDTAVVVLFVRAERATRQLARVELVRRPRGGLQRGYVWDATTDQMQSVDWFADRADATSSAPMPRGGPAPLAFRLLARRLLAIPCERHQP